YQDVQEIDSGAGVTKTFTWSVLAGVHTVRLVADSNDKIAESDENNNEKTVLFPTPDLIIEALAWSPESPAVGDAVTFTVTVKNQGSERAGNFNIDYYVDEEHLASVMVSPMAPGATGNLTFTWAAQVGLRTIKIIADSSGQVAEGDETNNEKAVDFIALAPDLTIEEITWSPEKPSKNEVVTFVVRIKNRGSAIADRSQVDYYIDDDHFKSASVTPIDPGATDNRTFVWTAQAGDHTIMAVTDEDDSVTESYEYNNKKIVAVSVFSPPEAAAPAPPAPEPAPAPAAIVPPAEKPASSESMFERIWPEFLFILAVLVLGSTFIVVIFKSR
ncbi:MAG: CARDB domain-containing protein, partial [Dehalococcoidales bacterium]